MHDALFRDPNERAIRLFFRHLSHLDAGACIDLLSEQVRHYMPFAQAGLPRLLEGKHRLLAYYHRVVAGHRWMRFPVHALHATETPGVFLVEYSTIARHRSGSVYINKSVAKFIFQENQIIEIVQYSNPLVVQEAADGKNKLRIPFHLN